MFPLVPPCLATALRDWEVRDGHLAQIEDAIGQIEGTDAAAGWASLAGLYGALGAPGVTLLICGHALAVVGVPDRLYSLRDRALVALGLATWRGGRPPDPAARWPFGAVELDDAAVAAWEARELAPVGGAWARGAEFALRLAGAKVGIARAPTA